MIDIAKKKLPQPAVDILVYLSYCAMSWFEMRGVLAYYCERNGFSGWIANDVWAFFIGGLLPFVLFELLTRFGFRRLSLLTGGSVDSARNTSSVCYGLKLTVIAANVVLFGLKFMYLALPLYANAINIILDPTVTIAFVSLYLLYAYKQNYVDKSRYRYVLTNVLGTFLVIYGLLALINMILALAA